MERRGGPGREGDGMGKEKGRGRGGEGGRGEGREGKGVPLTALCDKHNPVEQHYF